MYIIVVCREIVDFIASEIEYHKTTCDPENPRDLIDVYLNEMNKQSSNIFTETGTK